MKILYVFTQGRKIRLKALKKGQEIPMEFLFGAPYLQQQGYIVDILELDDFFPDRDSSEYRKLIKTNHYIQKHFRFTSSSHLFVGAIDQLNRYDVVIAGNENVAFGLADFKRQGSLKPPFIYFVMGMLAYIPTLKERKPEFKGPRRLPTYLYSRFYNTPYRKGKQIYQQLIRSCQSAIFIGKGEYKYASKIFRKFRAKFMFLPFAVDTDFWFPVERPKSSSPYILFMGNDKRRNFDLVIKIAERLQQFRFTFVTRRIVQEAIPPNVELFAGDWKEDIFPDVKIREFIQDCMFVILPLQETIQPSGQSVALQAMSCRKSVIISKTQGFWEPDVFIDKKHLIFVRSNSLNEWCDTIEHAVKNREYLRELGRNSRKVIERNNRLEQFGQKLEQCIVQGITGAGHKILKFDDK